METKKIKSSPNNLNFLKDLTKDSYCSSNGPNPFTFLAFKSKISDIYYLIYSKENGYIIFYDLNSDQTVHEIKISSLTYDYIKFSYFFDENKNRELMLTISPYNAKFWNINTASCLCNFDSNEWISCGCFAKGKTDTLVILCVFNAVKIFDLKGNYISSIKCYDKKNFHLIYYYFDKGTKQKFIILTSMNKVKSYNLSKQKKYFDYNSPENHQIVIHNSKNITKLIDGGYEQINIWNFHTGELLNVIRVGEGKFFRGICLWDDQYLLLGNENRILIIDINKQSSVGVLNAHFNFVLTIKKIIIPKYGECLISQGLKNDQIKLWIFDELNYI